MLFGKHDKSSSNMRTEHIDVRYYLIIDCITQKEGNLTVIAKVRCSQKPLQGPLFVKCYDLILHSVFDPAKNYNKDQGMLSRKMIRLYVTWV